MFIKSPAGDERRILEIVQEFLAFPSQAILGSLWTSVLIFAAMASEPRVITNTGKPDNGVHSVEIEMLVLLCS